MKLVLHTKKNRHTTEGFRSAKNSAGFTLIEILVVLGIFVIITTVVLAKNREFNNRIILGTLAYDVALSIREAQAFGIGSREAAVGSPEEFDVPYGINFQKGLMNRYKLFEDTTKNDEYFGLGDGPEGYLVKEYELQNGFILSDVCIFDQISGGIAQRCFSDGSGPGNINIIFKRPNPDAYIFVGNASQQYSRVEIYIQSPGGNTRTVEVTQTGQISVQNPS